MTQQDGFEKLLTSLYAAMLDDAQWPATSALIDAASGIRSNAISVGEGTTEDLRVFCVGLYSRGRRLEALEQDYFSVYHPIDERIPRLRKLPYRRLVRVADLYTEEELKASPAYNESLKKGSGQHGLNVRLAGPEGCTHITWALGDPVGTEGWSYARMSVIEQLLPHVQHFVAMRWALATAGALDTSVKDLLERRRLGVIQLDRRGRIVAANDLARGLLRRSDGLSDEGGILRAAVPRDRDRFERLLTDALPSSGLGAVGGWTRLKARISGRQLIVHVKPTPVPEPDYDAAPVAAVVLIVDPGLPSSIDWRVVGAALGLTPAESQVAAWLAEGRTVREIAAATERKERTVHWHLEKIYAKRGISRQVDLVRLVLSLGAHV